MHSRSPHLHLLSDRDSHQKHESPVVAQTSITSHCNVLKSPKEEGFREKIRDRSVPEATARSVAERVWVPQRQLSQVQVVDGSRSIKEVGTSTDSNSGVSPVGS